MKSRFIGLTLASLVLVGLLATPSGAQSSELDSYAGSADARALFLSVFGQEATFGKTHTEVASGAGATAVGTGLFRPDQSVSVVEATADAEGETNGSPDEICSPLSLPEIPVLSVSTACASGLASVEGGNPSATSTARVATIGVAPNDVLGQTPLPEAVNQIVDEVVANLGPLFDGLDEALSSDLDATVNDLVDAILGETSDELVGIELGGAESASTVLDDTMVSTSTSGGAVIDVLDRPVLGPVLRITVGKATSKVTSDLTTQDTEGTFDPALARIAIAPDVLAGLPADLVAALPLDGDAGNEIVVPVGATECLLPAPLTSCITVANGEITENDDGSVAVSTSAVALDLLTGIEGGISLHLADTAAAGGTVFAVVPQESPRKDPELPRTGGGPLGGATTAVVLGAAALGGLALRRRIAVV